VRDKGKDGNNKVSCTFIVIQPTSNLRINNH